MSCFAVCVVGVIRLEFAIDDKSRTSKVSGGLVNF